ncbi:MAG: endonuclease/exonuclease/phosphatase family protein [Chloroflexi bacterium]|nr:endonuclease/exonuclease/phosphatase family protein [Chloroflexota bacterium]
MSHRSLPERGSRVPIPARHPRARSGRLVAASLLAMALLLAAGAARAQPSFGRIREVQGAAHRSPAEGRIVDGLPGIVTLVRPGGFYLQDPEPDARPSTSEAIYVRYPAAGDLAPGDALRVGGTVIEERLDDAWLSTTLIGGEVRLERIASGLDLPEPVILGEGGRRPPNAVIDDDAGGDVETRGRFDATRDGIDFYESLEHMRVRVDAARVVGPSDEGTVVVLGDAGRAASGLDPVHGALTLAPDDFNPERIPVDPVAQNLPRLHLGAGFDTPIIGVLDYREGRFEILASERFSADASLPERDLAAPAGAGELSVASFNVKNLSAAQGPERFEALAEIIVAELAAPDLLILHEIQDDNGPGDGGLVSAALTLGTLVLAVERAGGPEYRHRSIEPRYNADGGAILSNIRSAFLYREDQGLAFVDRPGGDAETPVELVRDPNGHPALSLSPGRIEATNGVFASSRKPLAGEFSWRGQPLFVVGIHFNARLADDPLFGRFQPPVLRSEARRVEMGHVVNRFVTRILDIDPEARVLVAGDFNDFWFSETLRATAGTALRNLVEDLPLEQRYSYIYQGNAQAIDHVLISPGLEAEARVNFEILHHATLLASAAQVSDHDALLARFMPRDRGGAGPSARVYLPHVSRLDR